ncbi:NAD(P)H-quinone oxidoreductase [Pseudidiomarina salinarum]|uniref:NAD(P)H-quinone oxidoreductase n=1 Tax=Pseudidiomarina salinarum TaxID=435908 RepID=A0A094IVK7_9GAMM|nr:NAD(P)H-quinone oxidoreductase [Pseudidiomarina salinarum]KFZ31720.1 NAD(P)H-quinone oxidoreductase [Pseudidiomarina salinarum]RUO70509.1 NAD(P)H-quinone oxidoreductase [Pseudidiomarina salinarum]
MYGIFAVNGKPQRQTIELDSPGAHDVIIEVAFAGMNRADLVQLGGHYPPPPGASEVLGLEVSGRVTATGSAVSRIKVDDEVCALLSGGGYASHVLVPEGQVNPLPDGMTLSDAAGICEVFATAWFNLYMLAKLATAERLLLHAGASSVGQAALQLAAITGNPVFVTAGSDSKLELCKQLGAAAGWNRHQGSFVDAVRDWGGADVILDPVGGEYIGWDQQVLRDDGRLILIGLMGGREAQLDLGRMLMKRQRIQGSTLRSQSVAAKSEIMAQLRQHLWPHFASGRLTATIDKVMSIDEIESGFELMRKNATQGKIILEIQAAEA